MSEHTDESDVPARAYKPQGYTEADQRSDTSFLVGVRYGRERERARMLAKGYVSPSGEGCA